MSQALSEGCMLLMFAGYVSRLRSQDPARLTHKILQYRDAAWLRAVESNNNGSQLHGRVLKVWRWEQPLVKYASSRGVDDWHALASDHFEWKNSLGDMAMFLRCHR